MVQILLRTHLGETARIRNTEIQKFRLEPFLWHLSVKINGLFVFFEPRFEPLSCHLTWDEHANKIFYFHTLYNFLFYADIRR